VRFFGVHSVNPAARASSALRNQISAFVRRKYGLAGGWKSREPVVALIV
jgi:hypothetical protein